jgi:hypothetical protein
MREDEERDGRTEKVEVASPLSVAGFAIAAGNPDVCVQLAADFLASRKNILRIRTVDVVVARRKGIAAQDEHDLRPPAAVDGFRRNLPAPKKFGRDSLAHLTRCHRHHVGARVRPTRGGHRIVEDGIDEFWRNGRGQEVSRAAA